MATIGRRLRSAPFYVPWPDHERAHEGRVRLLADAGGATARAGQAWRAPYLPQLGELRWAALVITLGSKSRVRAVRDYLVAA